MYSEKRNFLMRCLKFTHKSSIKILRVINLIREWPSSLVGIVSLWPVGGSHTVPQTSEMNNSHLWHRPSPGRGSLDHQDHQAHCPHFHSQGKGSTPNLLHEKQKPGCWDMDYSIMGNAGFTELLSYPRDNVTTLHPLCHPDCWPSRCSLFPLLQPLLGWILEDRRKLVTRNIQAFCLLTYICVRTQSIHTFQFGFVFTVTNLSIVTQEFIIILLLLLLRMVHGHYSTLGKKDVWSNHHLESISQSLFTKE